MSRTGVSDLGSSGVSFLVLTASCSPMALCGESEERASAHGGRILLAMCYCQDRERGGVLAPGIKRYGGINGGETSPASGPRLFWLRLDRFLLMWS